MPAGAGGVVREEMFFMRVGVLRLRRTWVDVFGREVRDGGAGVLAAVLGVGVVVGWVVGRMV